MNFRFWHWTLWLTISLDFISFHFSSIYSVTHKSSVYFVSRIEWHMYYAHILYSSLATGHWTLISFGKLFRRFFSPFEFKKSFIIILSRLSIVTAKFIPLFNVLAFFPCSWINPSFSYKRIEKEWNICFVSLIKINNYYIILYNIIAFACETIALCSAVFFFFSFKSAISYEISFKQGSEMLLTMSCRNKALVYYYVYVYTNVLKRYAYLRIVVI